MRTARAVVPLTPGTRPRSTTAIVAANTAFASLSDEPHTPPRFIGYDTASNLGITLAAQHTRCAMYEADYTD